MTPASAGPMCEQDSVSVVIPCYNASRFLSEAIDSVLGQTLQPIEVLVVDDGSIDSSPTIIASYGPPVRLLQQPNQGQSRARNRGLDAASGEWIAFLDADDLWLPTKLERQIRAANPHTIAVHSNWYAFGDQDFTVDFSELPTETRYSLESFLVRGCHLNMSNLIVRRNVPARFPEWVRGGGEDTVYYLEIAKHGCIAHVPEVLSGTRFHAASHSARPGAMAVQHDTYERWLDENADVLPSSDVAALREKMLGRLLEATWAAYWARKWTEFHALRSYLTKYQHDAKVRELLRLRVLPPWLYSVKDWVDRAFNCARS